MNDLLNEVKRKKVPTKVDYLIATAIGSGVVALLTYISLLKGV